MSNRKKLLTKPVSIRCDACGMLFASPNEMREHWKNLPEGRLCLAPSSMRDRGFYRSRGAWHLPR